MRFYVPNIDEDLQAEHDKKVEEKNKIKQEKKEAEDALKEKNGEGAGEDDGQDSEDSAADTEDELTAAKVFNEKILEKAGLGDSAGDVLAHFPDMPLLVPRGKYSLDLYGNYVKFHGRTHNYKIMYENIVQLFELPRVDRDQVAILFQLSKHLTQGQTMHHFILMQVDTNRRRLKINLTPEELEQKYGNNLEQEMADETYVLLEKLFKYVARIDRIITPGDFRSALDGRSQAIRCSVKASEGDLYPLKSSLIFIQKPIIYIKHKEVMYVEFQRVGQQAGGTARFFDISVCRKDVGAEQFKNIDKKELKVLIEYFRKAGIKLRQFNADENQSKDIDDMLSDDIDQEIKQSQSLEKPEPDAAAGSKRKRVPVKVEVDEDEEEENDSDFVDEDESEDESFKEGSGSKSEGSEGSEGEEDDMDDDIDVDVIDKKEMAALKSNKVLDKKERRKE